MGRLGLQHAIRRNLGFTFVGVLFLIVLTASGMAAIGQAWSTAAQRERERELAFRGREIARAIASYVQASPTMPPQYPRSLGDLLVDSRWPQPRHHLRRLYTDPFTGYADWELVPEASALGTFSGVRSRSERLLLRECRGFNGDVAQRAKDLGFTAARYGLDACLR